MPRTPPSRRGSSRRSGTRCRQGQDGEDVAKVLYVGLPDHEEVRDEEEFIRVLSHGADRQKDEDCEGYHGR